MPRALKRAFTDFKLLYGIYFTKSTLFNFPIKRSTIEANFVKFTAQAFMQFSFLEELNNKGQVIIYVEGGKEKMKGGWG